MIILASARDELRNSTIGPLLEAGLAAASVADWSALCRAATDPEVPLLLVDPELPSLDPALLAGLSRSLAHGPTVVVVGEARPPLARVAATPLALTRLARRVTQRARLSAAVRRDLRFAGLGPKPLGTLASLASRLDPVLLVGERGTGKERIAATIHALAGRRGPMRVLPPEQALELGGAPGSVYLVSPARRPSLRAEVKAARAAGWAVIAGSRRPEPPAGVEWVELHLPPLRERPEALRGLATTYLEAHAARLGLPRRSFDKALWAAIMAHRWPENGRELESFVVAALTAMDEPVLRAREMPASVAARLQPRSEAVDGDLEGFEDVAEARLAPVVARFAPGPGPTLWDLVQSSTGRALLRLALQRTGGNRKAAAELLGLARNTLQAHIERYGLSAAPR